MPGKRTERRRREVESLPEWLHGAATHGADGAPTGWGRATRPCGMRVLREPARGGRRPRQAGPGCQQLSAVRVAAWFGAVRLDGLTRSSQGGPLDVDRTVDHVGSDVHLVRTAMRSGPMKTDRTVMERCG